MKNTRLRARPTSRHSTGIALVELAETSSFGSNARRELIRWFPSSPWIRTLEERPDLRARVHEQLDQKRRRFLLGASAVALSPVLGCSALSSALPFVFKLLEAAAKTFVSGKNSGGSAFFDNGSQSRESAQLLTRLVEGIDSSAYDNSDNYRDEADFLVNVPAKASDYAYLFEGLVSDTVGDYFLSGTAAGETLFSEIFKYV